METVEVKINTVDVAKLEVKPGQILVVSVSIPDDYPPEYKMQIQKAYGDAFRKTLDGLGFTSEQVPFLLSFLPVKCEVIDPPAPVLLPPAEETPEVEHPRGRPFTFTPEMLEKMANMPQPPEDDDAEDVEDVNQMLIEARTSCAMGDEMTRLWHEEQAQEAAAQGLADKVTWHTEMATELENSLKIIRAELNPQLNPPVPNE